MRELPLSFILFFFADLLNIKMFHWLLTVAEDSKLDFFPNNPELSISFVTNMYCNNYLEVYLLLEFNLLKTLMHPC